METKQTGDRPALTIHTDFPRFKDTFTLTVEETSNGGKEEGLSHLPCYVGDFFTEEGYFHEDGFKQAVVEFVTVYASKKKQ